MAVYFFGAGSVARMQAPEVEQGVLGREFAEARQGHPLLSFEAFLKARELREAPLFYSADPVTHAALQNPRFQNSPRGKFIAEYRQIKQAALLGTLERLDPALIDGFVAHTATIFQEDLARRCLGLETRLQITPHDALRILQGEKLSLPEYQRTTVGDIENELRKNLVTLGEPEDFNPRARQQAQTYSQDLFREIARRYAKRHPAPPQPVSGFNPTPARSPSPIPAAKPAPWRSWSALMRILRGK